MSSSSTKTPTGSNKRKNSSPPSLKQGTLFSFFSKKPASTPKAPPKSSPTATPPPAAAAGGTTSTSPSNHTSSVTPSSSSVSSASASSSPLQKIQSRGKWERVTVGMKLAVFWRDDGKYYPAKVTGRKKSHNGSTEFHLLYDDGETECLDLSTEKFKFITDDDDEEEDEEEAPVKKRRRVVNDDDDSDEEMEFNEKEDDEEFKDQGNGDEEDDDEEEAKQWVKDDGKDKDDWLVTDDEDEQPKKKKKASSSSIKRVKVTRVPEPKAPVPRKLDTKFSKLTPVKKKAPVVAATPVATKPTPSDTPRMYVDKEVNPAGAHVHNHLKFLRNPKDAQGRPADHPDYDDHSLKIDWNELQRHQNVTAGVKQWWDIKAQYLDTVLLFKTGKFYEMFHMDADLGVQLLDFCYMKGKVAHAGFPEISYGQFSDRLVRAGYKVARVEQTETPDQLKERKARTKSGPKPKVVNREVCSILSLGTRTFCYLDDVHSLLQSDGSAVKPLLAIREVMVSATEGDDIEGGEAVRPVCEYGVTLVDAARAVITIGEFADDVLRSRLHTLLTTFEPSEIIIEGGENGASKTLMSLIKSYRDGARSPVALETIAPSVSFPKSSALNSDIRRKMERKSTFIKPWNVEETLDELHRRAYFPRGSRQDTGSKSTSRWPKVLSAVVEGKANLALSSFGATLFHLQRNLIDQEILSMGTVKAYIPPNSPETTNSPLMENLAEENISQDLDRVPPMTPVAPEQRDPHVEFEATETLAPEEENINHMALDGTTLQNLEVLTNTKTHTAAGSLWSKINHTKTPHGSRMLRAWLLRPLFRKADIDRRADAVEELVSGGAAVAIAEARQVLSKCGDIERLLSRVHSMSGGGNNGQPDNGHPNERAVLYEGATHTKRKVGDFSKLLSGLRHTTRIPELFEGIGIKSGLLRKIVCPISKGGCFPDMESELDFFFDNFDCELAAKGLFEPSRGVDEDYDDACDAVQRIKGELEDYKEETCSEVLRGSSRTSWKYANIKDDSKDKYLIELPAGIRVPGNFIVKGKRGKGAKQVNKYRTREVEELVEHLENALDVQKAGKARGMQLIFAKFDTSRSLWSAAAQTSAMLDALGSLAEASGGAGFTRPTILTCPQDVHPSVHIVQGRHACVDITHNGGQFIPNDLTLGQHNRDNNVEGKQERVLLLSGPNMGGKSTLLRQTSLITILAQIGCYVPAEECALTPVDRIFTRLGASDRILLGQSTFFVELAETASALRGATRRSLVIMDELGRGTSTFDGTAIASACVQHLVQNNQCLTLFATHYHSLLTEWKDEASVRLGHMECYVENGVEEDSEEAREKDHNITFLYTLGDGPCPASFGINVAKLAGLPDEVLSRAKQMSTTFEKEMSNNEDDKISPEAAEDLCSRLAAAIESGDDSQAASIWDALNNDAVV